MKGNISAATLNRFRSLFNVYPPFTRPYYEFFFKQGSCDDTLSEIDAIVLHVLLLVILPVLLLAFFLWLTPLKPYYIMFSLFF